VLYTLVPGVTGKQLLKALAAYRLRIGIRTVS